VPPVPPLPSLPLNAWLRISPDNRITVLVDRAEMGQDVSTALPMLLAEELGVHWSSITTEFAPAGKMYDNPDFGMQGTGGSSSVRVAWLSLRQTGAAAREMLISAAVAKWNVNRAECRAESGRVLHTASKKSLSYGELVAAAAALPMPKDVPLRGRTIRFWEIVAHTEQWFSRDHSHGI